MLRTRTFAATLLLCVMVAGTFGGPAVADECDVGAGVDTTAPGGAVFEGSCEDGGAGSGGAGGAGDGSGAGNDPGEASGGSGGDGAGADPAPRAFEPFWGTDPATGLPCIALVPRPEVTPDSTTAIGWERRTGEMYADPRVRDAASRYCPASTASPVDPVAVARAFVRSVTVPAPDIVIAPGIAVTGLPAYLEVRGQDTRVVTEPIAGFGTLVVTLAASEFTVDWGDGHVEVIEDGRRGVPWQDRDIGAPISHVYTARGPGNVVGVEGRWVADWTLGAHRGQVTGIAVDAQVELPVVEYLAVRLSPMG